VRNGISKRKARDLVWCLTGSEVYRMLVLEKGWTSDEYEEWLGESLVRELLLVDVERIFEKIELRVSMIVGEQARKLMQELVEAVNQHDTRRVMKLYADNACAVSPVAGEIVGIEAVANWWETTFSLFPDWSATLSDMLIDGDRLAFFGTIKATDQNGWFGLPATGQPFEYRGIVV